MPESRKSLRVIFIEALEIRGPQERAAYLEKVCGADTSLRNKIEELIVADAEASGFLAPSVDDRPAEGTLKSPPPPSVEASESALDQELDESPSEKPGDRIGHYKLLQKIGEGGYGTVYMAEQEKPVRRRVALKVIKLGMDTKAVVARFEAERQALALMDHPNIAKVLDAGATSTGRPFFVMELVKGIRITHYCDQNNLNLGQRLDLFIKVAQAIQHAHQKGVIHRDIKPSNIMVTLHDGVAVPKVIDFGIAKATEQKLTEKTLFTQYETFIGTPAYTSPEQAEMSGLDIDTRTDVYALGVLLYELLTGKTPFDGKALIQSGLVAMRRTIREAEPPRPSTKLNTLEGQEITTLARHHGVEAYKLKQLLMGDMDWIVMKCLEKDRTRRYDTANGLAMDIQRYLKNEPIMARPPSSVYRVQKFIRRNKLVFTASTSVVLALIVGLAISTWQFLERNKAYKEASTSRLLALAARDKAEGTERIARQNSYASDMNSVQTALETGNLWHGKELVNRNIPQAGQEDLRGWEWYYFWDETRSDAKAVIMKRPTTITRVAFHPNGKQLIVRDISGRIVLVDVNSGKQIEFSNDRETGYRTLAVSSTGDLAWGTEQFVKVRNLLTATETDPIIHYSPLWVTFSHNGRLLATVGQEQDAPDRSFAVRLWDVKSRTSLPPWPIKGHRPSAHYGVAAFSSDSKTLAMGDADGKISLIDVKTGMERTNYQAHSLGISALAYSPEGWLASGAAYADPIIKLWHAKTGQKKELKGHIDWIGSLAFTPNGERLVSAGSDQTVRVWDMKTFQERAAFQGHEDEVWTVAVSPDGQTAASGGEGGRVIIWDLNGIPRRGSRAVSCDGMPACLPNNRLFYVSNSICWQTSSEQKSRQISILGTNVSSVAVSSGGHLLAVGDRDGQITRWTLDSNTQQLLTNGVRQTNVVGHGTIRRLRFSTADNILVSRSEDFPREQLWEVGSWQEITPWKSGSGPPWMAVDVSPTDTNLVVCGYESGDVTFWDRRTGRIFWGTHAHPYATSSVAFSPDGNFVAAGSYEGSAKVWHVASRQLVAHLRGSLGGVSSLAWSPDGRRLATFGIGLETVRLWDTASWQEVAALKSDHETTTGAFSPDGKTLVAYYGKQASLWHTDSWKEMKSAAKNLAPVIDSTATAFPHDEPLSETLYVLGLREGCLDSQLIRDQWPDLVSVALGSSRDQSLPFEMISSAYALLGDQASQGYARASQAVESRETYYRASLRALHRGCTELGQAVQVFPASQSAYEKLSEEIEKDPPEFMLRLGSTWKYLNEGSDQGKAWKEPDFNDGSWTNGSASLGYGVDWVGTNQSFTLYLRNAFMVEDSSKYGLLRIRLLRRDGAVVYLNGKEILLHNMPREEISHSTFALPRKEGAGETNYVSYFALPSGFLRSGKNVLAAEVHQDRPWASDLSFDLELQAYQVSLEEVVRGIDQRSEFLKRNRVQWPWPEEPAVPPGLQAR